MLDVFFKVWYWGALAVFIAGCYELVLIDGVQMFASSALGFGTGLVIAELCECYRKVED